MRLLPLALATAWASSQASSDYSESLNLRPLPKNMLLATFEFGMYQPTSGDFSVFPRSLGQILDGAGIDELHLHMSSGWWDAENWGAEPGNGSLAGGIGAELWAWVRGSTIQDAQARWHRLVYALSGHFCASVNFIDETLTSYPTVLEPYSAATQGFLFRGALPAEPVCTENLTPFLKLLPCKSSAGVASLLEGHHLFDSQWQSLSVDVFPDPDPNSTGRILHAAVAAVADVERTQRRRESPLPVPVPTESLQCDPNRPGASEWSCYPARNPAVEWSLTTVFGHPIRGECPLAHSSTEIHVDAPSNWQVTPDNLTLDGSRDFEIVLSTEDSSIVSPTLPSKVLVDRSFTGWGQQRGGLRTVFTNPGTEPLELTYFETLPWFMRLYLHTLDLPEGARLARYTAAEDRGRPSQLEFHVVVQPGIEGRVALEYKFEKSLLFLEEYPPDANHGFEVAPGLAVGQDFIVRTSSLLVSLPVPDFSMPYNVVIFTSTVMTLAFGTLFNLVTRKVVPEAVADAQPKLNPLQKMLNKFGRIVRR